MKFKNTCWARNFYQGAAAFTPIPCFQVILLEHSVRVHTAPLEMGYWSDFSQSTSAEILLMIMSERSL